MSLVNPSFSNGFSSPWYGGRLKYPNLWRGCVGAWSPILGPTGATLFDMSGYHRHGTLTNFNLSTAWSVGSNGSKLLFDGGDDCISIPLTWTPPRFSITFWLTPNYLSSYNHAIQGDTSGWGAFTFHTEAGGAVFCGTDVFSRFYVSSVLSVGVTACLTYTHDGSQGRLYKNGILIAGPTSQNQSTQWTSFRFGATHAATISGDFHGGVVHDYAITPGTVSLLAQRPGIMYELDDSDVWGAVEAGGGVVPWYYLTRSRVLGGGVT